MKKIFLLLYLFISIATQASRLVLLGDALLENFHWVGPENNIATKLQQKVGNLQIVNLTVPDCTSDNILNGKIWDNTFRTTNENLIQNEYFLPLTYIRKNDIVILSIGGNDARHAFSKLNSMPEAIKKFQNNFKEIIRQLKLTTQKILIVLPYKPESTYFLYTQLRHYDDNPMQVMEAIMEGILEPLVQLALNENLGTVDLTNSFDPNSKDLYATFIQASIQGGEIIAQLLEASAARLTLSIPRSPLIYTFKNNSINISLNRYSWRIDTNRSNNEEAKFQGFKNLFK